MAKTITKYLFWTDFYRKSGDVVMYSDIKTAIADQKFMEKSSKLTISPITKVTLSIQSCKTVKGK